MHVIYKIIDKHISLNSPLKTKREELILTYLIFTRSIL